jgi:hypothetical protein
MQWRGWRGLWREAWRALKLTELVVEIGLRPLSIESVRITAEEPTLHSPQESLLTHHTPSSTYREPQGEFQIALSLVGYSFEPDSEI